jgi:prepilin-type N-terminal cleavage/methylation domain-containing protein
MRGRAAHAPRGRATTWRGALFTAGKPALLSDPHRPPTGPPGRPPAMLLRPSPAASHRTAAQRGFSLVELLVVLGIIAAMAGMVLGGLFRSRDGNRLLAAEQVLADAIRQCRHTARSTGAPVELRLTPVVSGNEVVGAKLGGTSRTVLWSETFDRTRDSNDDGAIDDRDLGSLTLPEPGQPANGVVLGRSGNGRLVSAQHAIPPQTLPRGATIVRSGRSDGFYLSCSVQAPPITGINLSEIPLVIIGGDGSVEDSQCGIGLIAKQSIIQNSNPKIMITYWDLTGWVFDDAGHEVALNVSTDPITSRLARETWADDKPEVSTPISGGRWVDVGLLYDGRRMVLYIDGIRVAERRNDVPARLRADGDVVHVGTRLILGSPATIEYASAPIDDIRLFRLGTSDVADLPGNVVLVTEAGKSPTQNLGWRILCQPDGRVEVSRDDDSNTTPVNDRVTTVTTGRRTGDTATIVLAQLRAPGTLQNAELTVTLDGRVNSRLVTGSSGNGNVTQDKP